jgi:hypothetical protein
MPNASPPPAPCPSRRPLPLTTCPVCQGAAQRPPDWSTDWFTYPNPAPIPVMSR